MHPKMRLQSNLLPPVSVFTLLLTVTISLSGCGISAHRPPDSKSINAVHLTRSPFGVLPDGTRIDQFTMTNTSGAEVRVINYGGIITAIKVPDRHGHLADVVLGYDTFENYIANPRAFGPIIGRHAGRIAKGKFTLEGKDYQLTTNNPPNALHGGRKNFGRKVWSAEPFEKADEAGVVLTYVSVDGEENYPGTLTTQVTYTFNAGNELSVEYSATTDKTTVVNFTNHSYFNLGGEGSGDILNHELMINADHYAPYDANDIPLGHLASVADTHLDFRTPIAVGTHMEEVYKTGLGYDFTFALNHPKIESSKARGKALTLAARVRDPKTGRALEVRTTEPAMQLYTANHLDGTTIGKAGHAYVKHAAYCLETYHFPDTPNQPAFPTTTLKPGDTFYSKTVFAFSAK